MCRVKFDVDARSCAFGGSPDAFQAALPCGADLIGAACGIASTTMEHVGFGVDTVTVTEIGSAEAGEATLPFGTHLALCANNVASAAMKWVEGRIDATFATLHRAAYALCAAAA